MRAALIVGYKYNPPRLRWPRGGCARGAVQGSMFGRFAVAVPLLGDRGDVRGVRGVRGVDLR